MNSPTTPTEALDFFLDGHGMAVVPIVKGAKSPKDKGWNTKLDYVRGDFAQNANVGLMLGAPIGTMAGWRIYDIDIDLNTEWARRIIEYLLPTTGWVFGRVSKPKSHRLYAAQEGINNKAWAGLSGPTALEFRGRTADGKKYMQTVAPGSRHIEGEAILFEEPRGDLARVAGTGLFRMAQLAAVAMVIGECWPSGERHKATMCWAAVLKSADVTQGEAQRVLEAVTYALEGEPWKDAFTCCRDTYSKDDGPQLGAGWVRENIDRGAEAVLLVQKHLGVYKAVALAEARGKFARYFVAQVGGKKRQTVIGDERVFPPAYMSFEAFRQLYSNTEVLIDKHKTTEAELWLRDRKRRQYDRVEFAPPPHQVDADVYNLWKGYSVEPDAEPHPELRCALYLAHVRQVICDGDEAIAEFLLDVLAAKVQKPGELTEVAIVTRSSTHGAGKNRFVEPFLWLFGDHAVLLDKPELAVGRFNASLSSKVAVALDEALWPGHKEFSGALKSWVTNRTIMIEYKGVDATPEPNYAQIFVMTNRDWAWPAEETDRRALVLDVPPTRVGQKAYWDALIAEQKPGGLGQKALLAYLLQRPVTHNLRAIPATKALGRQKDLTLPLELEWWHECLILGEIEEQAWPERIASRDLYLAYLAYARAHHARRILSQPQLGMKLKEYLVAPGGHRGVRPKVALWDRDPATKRILSGGNAFVTGDKRDGWELPALGDARQLWDVARKQVTDWDDLAA